MSTAHFKKTGKEKKIKCKTNRREEVIKTRMELNEIKFRETAEKVNETIS